MGFCRTLSRSTVVFHLLFITIVRQARSAKVINPVVCWNSSTGESGFCMFTWSCIHVAHGIHIAPCMDRFLIGSCCKLPKSVTSNPNTTSEETPISWSSSEQTVVQKNETSVHPLYENISTKLHKKQEQNLVNVPKIYEDFSTLKQSLHLLKPEISSAIPSVAKYLEDNSANMHIQLWDGFQNPSESITTNSFFKKAHFSDKTKVKIPLHGTQIALFDVQKTVPTEPTYSVQKLVTEASHNLQMTMTSEIYNNFGKPYFYSDLQKHVTSNTIQNLRKPVTSDETHNLRKPVTADETHNLRKPVKSDETHNLRKPVVSDGNNLFGSWRLNQTSSIGNPFKNTEVLNMNISLFNSSVHDDNFKHMLSFLSHNSIHNLNGLNTDSETEVITSAVEVNLIGDTSTVQVFSQPTTTPEKNEMTKSSIVINRKNCGISRSRKFSMARIVGGRIARYLEWPWMVSLQQLEGKMFKHKCGAVLLNNMWVITVAHCVDKKHPNEILLRLGDYDLYNDNEFYSHVEMRVLLVVAHPDFNPLTYENDLALLRFYHSAPRQVNIAPVCLANPSYQFQGKTALVTGWGRLSENGELPAELREVWLPILTNDECEEMYAEAGYYEAIADGFICAGIVSGGFDACEGDSGGPMVVKDEQGQWSLIGLISWGIGCAAPKQPGVYIKITKYLDWIENIISI